MSAHCASCGAPRTAAARFCGACGAPTALQRRVVHERVRGERAHMQRGALALGVACSATLFGLLGGAELVSSHRGEWLAEIAAEAVVFTAALLSALVVGGLRAATPLRTGWLWCAASVPIAIGSLAAAFTFVALFAGDGAADPHPATTATVVAAVVLTPMAEEWLCRGASWRAALALGSPRSALILTSVLFAFLHGLGGGYLLELPHRFVAGLLFGWLRLRSGSLVPGVLAHALHNFGAVVLWP